MRVAYLSSDFRAHPVGTTIIAALECHDRSRFEITALSLTPKPDCPVQERIKAAVEHFIDIHPLDDEAVMRLLREREIDIAIDLNGLSGTRRSRILLRRPVPLQAAYLGYPGTTAMPFMDYVIADRSVIPEENRALYSEKVAYLPNSYLPYDRKRGGAQTLPGRGARDCPKPVLCSPASIARTRLCRRYSTSGCDCSARWKAACCGWPGTGSLR